jgi:hypothetical protein
VQKVLRGWEALLYSDRECVGEFSGINFVLLNVLFSMQDVASKRDRLLQCFRVIAIVKALFYFNLDFDEKMKKKN